MSKVEVNHIYNFIPGNEEYLMCQIVNIASGKTWDNCIITGNGDFMSNSGVLCPYKMQSLKIIDVCNFAKHEVLVHKHKIIPKCVYNIGTNKPIALDQSGWIQDGTLWYPRYIIDNDNATRVTDNTIIKTIKSLVGMPLHVQCATLGIPIMEMVASDDRPETSALNYLRASGYRAYNLENIWSYIVSKLVDGCTISNIRMTFGRPGDEHIRDSCLDKEFWAMLISSKTIDEWRYITRAIHNTRNTHVTKATWRPRGQNGWPQLSIGWPDIIAVKDNRFSFFEAKIDDNLIESQIYTYSSHINKSMVCIPWFIARVSRSRCAASKL